MSCGKIFADNIFDCDKKPVSGLRQRVILINFDDFKAANPTFDVTLSNTAGTHKITSLTLPTGVQGYSIEGIAAKQIITSGYTFNEQELVDDWTHTVNISLWNQCEDALVFLKGLGEGALVVAIVEYKVAAGNGDCKYHVYGPNKGLKLRTAEFVSTDNNGTVPLSLGSPDGDNEPYPPMLYFNTDEATTDAEVEALLTPAP